MNNINTTKKTKEEDDQKMCDKEDIKQENQPPDQHVKSPSVVDIQLDIDWEIYSPVYLNSTCTISPTESTSTSTSSKRQGQTEFDASTNKFDTDHFRDGFTSELLGCGGHGRVYRSVCNKTGKVYVIKSICLIENYNLSNVDLNREFGIGISLVHDNIIKFEYTWYGNCEHEVCRTQDIGSTIINNNNNNNKPRHSFFILMEYSNLQSINKQMNKPSGGNSKLNGKEIKEIIKQLIATVKYMHSLGIIHGDISKDNILFGKSITSNGTPVISIKVIDFGYHIH